MPLEMRKTSQWWYGRFNVNGKVHVVNLGLKIAGDRPPSITEDGDRRFEQSRLKAKTALEALVEEAKERKHGEELVQKLHQIRTGSRVPSILLTEVFDRWQEIPKKRRPKKSYIAWAHSVFERFVSFTTAKYSDKKEMADIDRKVAVEFMRAEEKRNVSNATWNLELFLLRSAFKHLAYDAGVFMNPFDGIVNKENESIHRKPFSPDELKVIIDAAADDDFMRPLIITAICTAMRRGDVCLLKWSDVDMEARFICAKTSKTGDHVNIPMFPLLYDELAKLEPGESEYVFPEQARMYEANPHGINWRIKKVLAKAGFLDSKKKMAKTASTPYRGDIHVDRPNGLAKANVRGFHSFRTTWVTLALTAGVPLEIVRKVTGHRTVQIVLDNYFQPGRDAFREALQAAMPQLLTNGSLTREEQIRRIVKKMTPKTCSRDKKKILALLPSPSHRAANA